MDIDITGIDPAEILRRAVNEGRAVGMGVFNNRQITYDEAKHFLDVSKGRLDYVAGVPVKAEFRENTWMRADLYDRDQGDGSAQRIVTAIREGK